MPIISMGQHLPGLHTPHHLMFHVAHGSLFQSLKESWCGATAPIYIRWLSLALSLSLLSSLSLSPLPSLKGLGYRHIRHITMATTRYPAMQCTAEDCTPVLVAVSLRRRASVSCSVPSSL